MAIGIDLRQPAARHKGIVRGHRAIAVDTYHRAIGLERILRQIGLATLANRQKQRTVRRLDDPAGEMLPRPGLVFLTKQNPQTGQARVILRQLRYRQRRACHAAIRF